MDLNFARHKHLVYLSPSAYGDIEYKQRKNWGASNHIQRERANLMFNRLHESLYYLANITNFSDFTRTSFGEYQFTVSDGFAVICFELYQTQDSLIIYVTEFLWPYKKHTTSWWYIVENNQRSMNIRLAEDYIRKMVEEEFRKCLYRL